MVLRTVVVLLVLAVLGRRFLPQYRLTWALPLVLGATVLVVRGLAYALTAE